MSNHTGEGPPACPVCGAAIDSDPRLCARCETPHHADCWGYTGRCAVYACNGLAVVGDLPVPVPPGGALAPVAARSTDGPAALSLADSAARVAAIVPVPGARNLPTELCWTVDATGAWLGRRDPSVTVAPGERVVMLPGRIRQELAHPDERAHFVKMVAAGVGGAVLAAVGLLQYDRAAGGARIAMVIGLSVLASAVQALASVKRPELLWVGVTAKGTWVHGVTAGRPWEFPVAGDAAPVRVRLDRAYEDGRDDASRTLITYRLVLEWAAPGYRGRGPRPGYDLAPALQMPETVEARRPMLEQLVARRELGQHIAALLAIPFVEGVKRS